MNEIWFSYDFLKSKPLQRQKQINNLCYSAFEYDNYGQAACYLPLSILKETEKNCLELYDAVDVLNHEVSICDEIYYTTKIEGAHTTRKRTTEIHNGEYIDKSNFTSEKMVQNGFQATKYLNLINNQINEQSLIKVWNILTKDVCENEDIKGSKYRIGDVLVGNILGLSSEQVETAMEHWIDYYNSDAENDSPLIKAALLHYTFERIHPFPDGNGRLGRLLMSNFLILQGYDKIKAISFSKDIGENVSGYYNALNLSGNNYFDCTPFLQYMLESMNRTFVYAYLQSKLGELVEGLNTQDIYKCKTKDECDVYISLILNNLQETEIGENYEQN